MRLLASNAIEDGLCKEVYIVVYDDNNFGAREWSRNDNPSIRAIKEYSWCDAILIIDESNSRRVLDVITMEDLQGEMGRWTEIKDD